MLGFLAEDVDDKLFKIKFLLLTFLIFGSNVVLADHCVVSQIDIVAGTWENSDSQTSLTVQTQDSSGASCHAGETIRLSFSTSGGGSFTNEAGTSLPQAYISTNSANRNFYYQGSVNDSITINAGPGPTDSWTELWSVSKQVTDILGSVEEEVEDNNDDSGSSSSSSGSLSSHSSPVDLSTSTTKPKFDISAGRDRLAMVGVPVIFSGETTSGDNTSKIKFNWTFGDGSSGFGKQVQYIYKYPGQYTVVSNASSNGAEAVARTEVLVIKPEVSIKEIVANQNGLGLVVENRSGYEINIGGFKVKSGQSEVVLPVDTIIKSGATITLADVLTTGFDGRALLIDSLGQVVEEHISTELVGVFEPKTVSGVTLSPSQLEEITKQALVIKYKLAEMGSTNLIKEISLPKNSVAQVDKTGDNKGEDKISSSSLSQVALAQNMITVEKPKGLMKSILSLPQVVINLFK